MEIAVAAKKKNGEWRGALIADHKFADAFIYKSLVDMVESSLSGVLAADYPDGQQITVTITVEPAKVPGGQS